MNWMEQLLIIGGVSLDIYAAMERQGSMVAKIEKLRLVALLWTAGFAILRRVFIF